MKQTAAAIFFILALLRSAQADDPAILGQGTGLADFVVSVCDPAPQSDLCQEAEGILRARVIKSLLELGASGSRERAYAAILAYVDHPEPDIRAAALAALGGLYPDAQDTALLVGALNDPIPAIRSAALSSLVQSSDPATTALVDRARDDQGMSLEPDLPPDGDLLGVSLPPNAEPLRFTDDAPEGVVAFVTNHSAQEVLDFYAAHTGRVALPLAAVRQLLLPAWAASSGMAFYQELGKRMEELGALPQEQQLSAQYRLALIMALSQEGQLPAEFDRWQDEERWGDVRVMALALDPLLEMPSQLLLVYQDRDLQRTGFALQWLPALDFPAALVPQSRPAETPIAPAEDLDRAALEQTIWEAVAWRGTAAAYGAYLKALPQGAHASEAQAALDSLGKVSTPMSPAPQVAAPPGQAALSIEGIPRQMETLVINYVGMPDQRTPWVTVVPAQLPDDQWSDWAYVNPGSGKVTLPGQPAGNYEIRALLENPREVIARLPVTILPSEAGPPNLSLLSEPRAQEPIHVHFSNLPGDKGDWISVVPARLPDSEWGAWVYSGGTTEGDVTLPGQPAGDYELRAYTEKPQREVLVRLRLNILP